MAPGGLVRHFPEHLGTAFLRTMLHRSGIPSRQYIPPRNPGLNGFAADLKAMKPAVVGFTVYETNLVLTRALVRVVRETLPEAVVLVGGPNATFSPEETLELLGADGCLRGAGEGRIVPIVEAVLGASSPRKTLGDILAHVKNLVLRTPDGVAATPLGSLSSFPDEGFATLDDLPSPFQAGLVFTPDIGYLTARGCNQHCTYCSFAAISGRKVKFHSPDRVVDDLAALKALSDALRSRNPTIPIFDDAFTLAPARARKICEMLIARGIRLPLNCVTRGDCVDVELLQLMRRAGFVSLSFGLESAVPRVLRAIGKVRPSGTQEDPQFKAETDFLEKLKLSVKLSRETGLRVGLSIIGGLPEETPDDFRATLAFVESLGVEYYVHNTLNLFPGTPLFDSRQKYGLDASRDLNTLQWETRLAFSMKAIQPLNTSSAHLWKWESVAQLSDALCGRPHLDETDDDSVWAVIIHGQKPSVKLLRWIGRVVAINGTLVVLGGEKASEEEWISKIAESRLPIGQFFLLLPDEERDLNSWVSTGRVGCHHIELCSTWTKEQALTPVHVDEWGDCHFRLWIASASGAGSNVKPIDSPIPAVGPGLQIADSCRWWYRSPRCSHPRVLHTDSSGNVRACWNGPVVGDLRSTFDTIIENCRKAVSPHSDRRSRPTKSTRCPLATPGETHLHPHVEDLDLASQITWMFPRRAIEKPNLTGG